MYVELIDIDPPFAAEANFETAVKIGDNEIDHTKEASAVEELAYRATWVNKFISLKQEHNTLIREILKKMEPK